VNHLVPIRELIAHAKDLVRFVERVLPNGPVLHSDPDISGVNIAIRRAEMILDEGRKPGEPADVYLDRMELELERRFAAELASQSQPPGGAWLAEPLRKIHVGVDLASGVSETTLGMTGRDSTTQDAPLVKLGPGGAFNREYRPVSIPVIPPDAYLPKASAPSVGGNLDTQA
jgi:hypothetical protein